MELGRDLQLLRLFVEAHTNHGGPGAREPLYYMKFLGGATLQHPGLGGDVPEIDETDLNDLQARGLIDIGYSSNMSTLIITPTIEGRELVEALEAAEREEPEADVQSLIEAVEFQQAQPSKLAWPAVRPVLAALRRYWEDAGFPSSGVAIRPLLATIPDGTENLFTATVKSLMSNDYIVGRPANLAMNDLPVWVVFTDATFRVLDGWPGASDRELAENLIAILTEQEEKEPDPEKKRAIRRVLEGIEEIGVKVAAEYLSKAVSGG